MARFRLRFLLQEFDLVGPEVVIGRSPDCHITIEDPLVSRQHARLRIASDTATVVDLGSRNGVRVNGERIDGERSLADGDRVRLGTQELVFLTVTKQGRDARPTGFMRMCAACDTPYPEVSPQCPHCGATESHDDDTISGLVVEPSRSWTFQLLGEVIERALGAGRSTEADRLMRRAAKEVDERLERGDCLDPNQIAMISGFAIRLAQLLGQAEWIEWTLEVHQRQRLMPSSAVIDRLEALPTDAFPHLRDLVDAFVSWYRGGATEPSPELARLDRLEKLTQ